MNDWVANRVNILADCLYNEFIFMKNKLNNKNETIYGMALVLDSDALTGYLIYSTLESLNNIHLDKKWFPTEWLIGTDDGDVEIGIDYFIEKHIEFYDDRIVPLFRTQKYDYSIEYSKYLKLFFDGMKLTKQKLNDDFNNLINDCVFLVCIPGEDDILIKSAKEINLNSDELSDFLMFYE